MLYLWHIIIAVSRYSNVSPTETLFPIFNYAVNLFLTWLFLRGSRGLRQSCPVSCFNSVLFMLWFGNRISTKSMICALNKGSGPLEKSHFQWSETCHSYNPNPFPVIALTLFGFSCPNPWKVGEKKGEGTLNLLIGDSHHICWSIFQTIQLLLNRFTRQPFWAPACSISTFITTLMSFYLTYGMLAIFIPITNV